MSPPEKKLATLPAAIEQGLFVVQVPLAMEPLTTLVMLDQIAGARGDLGMQMPKVAQVNVFCGGSPVARSRFQKIAMESNGHAELLEFIKLREGIGSQPIALELLPTWLPSLEEAKKAPWWVIRHVLPGHPGPNVFKALGRVRATLRKAGTRGLLMLATDDAANCSGLDNVADDYLIVSGCEDGLKSSKCISFECPNASAFAPFNSAKVMCSIFPSPDGLRFLFEPFISQELDVRVMARLRGGGYTYSQIGKVVRADQSTALRRLRGIRTIARPIDPNWLEAVKDHYDS